ncbi:ABC transporter permease [Rhizobium sp. NFR03]|uniref:ABC transporter permease n=1 Tax=Rhizobium sp. NFR03 TaxID=1566263 RepID=UPI0008C69F05|nr:ABC transporter permease [Rhizobium sp. NFR03]SES39179.1 capsular polysaccharide transport system permease protein [Rhizobium sp. NFR03]
MKMIVVHWRVTAALVIREMSVRFGRKPGGYVWAVLDPAAHILLLTLIFQTLTRTPALGTSFALFFATGYLGFHFYQATANYVNSAIKSNRSLLTYPNVAPIDTIVARAILQIITTAFVATIVLTALQLRLRVPQTVTFPPLIEAATLAALLGVSVGLFNNVMFQKYPLYEQIYNIVHRPLFMISGIFFLPDAIPNPYRDIVLLNPLVHVTMLFRTGFYPSYRATGLDMGYLTLFVVSALIVGMTVFTVSSSVLRSE